MSREVFALVITIMVCSVALTVAALAAERVRLTTPQILGLAGVLVLVVGVAMLAVFLPDEPAAILAILAFGWLGARATGPAIVKAARDRNLLLAIVISVAAGSAFGAIIVAIGATR